MTIGKALGAGTPGIESGGACAECLWGCETISRNDTVLVKYAYLADGMKASAFTGGGAGLVYRGSLVFRRDSLGTLSFESAPIAAGRMTANGVRYHVTDHLGSVRGVVDGATGALYEASRYGAYGHRSEETNLRANLSVSTPPAGEASFRYHYTGQEDQGADFGLPYTDFGARHYSPSLRRWLVPDPLNEQYYDVSPYAYCAGDPVNCVDVGGEAPHVIAGAIGGATIGAIISGSIAYSHGQRGREFWGAVAGGAVNGAVSGALVAVTGGASLVSSGAKDLLVNTLAGAIGGVAGSATEQAISKGSIDSSQLINDTSFGAVSGAVSGGLNHLSSYNKVNIQSHYMSSKTQDNLTKEVAREYKSMGKQISGKATKQTIQKEVSERTTTLITVSQTFEEGICNTVDVAQRYIFQVGDYQMNSFLFDE